MELQKFIVDPDYFKELDLHYWPAIAEKINKGELVYKSDPDMIGLIREVMDRARLDIDYVVTSQGPIFLATNAVCFTMMGAELNRKGYLRNVW